MNDKEIMNEFSRLYSDYKSIDKALVEIKKIIAPREYSRLVHGLARLMK